VEDGNPSSQMAGFAKADDLTYFLKEICHVANGGIMADDSTSGIAASRIIT
jgi:hypothetical protein